MFGEYSETNGELVTVRDEARSRLARHAPGPWISIGGYLDYTNWPERHRFLWLDEQIASEHRLQELRSRQTKSVTTDNQPMFTSGYENGFLTRATDFLSLGGHRLR